MIVYPNAKINLGLYVTARRPDGYHAIDSVFVPISWSDVLEVIPASGSPGLQLELSGIPVDGDPDGNLCQKAFTLLDRQFGLGTVQAHLHKQLPLGAGLGGGSSDGAFMLKALNTLFDLKLDSLTLEKYAAQLGSDCPFFIRNTPAYVTGRGEISEAIRLPHEGLKILLVNPGLHLSTAAAYGSIQAQQPRYTSKEIVENEPLDRWKNLLHNDFEKPVLATHPPLTALKNRFYDAGALYASMTGSGSTFYGLFDTITDEAVLKIAGEYKVFHLAE